MLLIAGCAAAAVLAMDRWLQPSGENAAVRSSLHSNPTASPSEPTHRAAARYSDRSPRAAREPDGGRVPAVDRSQVRSPEWRTGEAQTTERATEAEELRWRARRVGLLEEQLASEPIDRAWARGIEQTVRAHDEGLLGSTIGSVRCASTICAIEAEHDDVAVRRDFQVDLVQSMGGALQHAFVQWYDDGDRLRTVMFMARPGHLLPAPERD